MTLLLLVSSGICASSYDAGLGDEVSLLQVKDRSKEHTEKHDNAHKKAPAQPVAEIASMVPDCNTVCYQGPADLIAIAHTALSMSSNAGLYTNPVSSAIQPVTCTSRGFGVLQDNPDDCWGPAQKWVADPADMDAWGGIQFNNWNAWEAATGHPAQSGMSVGGCTCLPGYRCPPAEGMCERNIGPSEATSTYCQTLLSQLGLEPLFSYWNSTVAPIAAEYPTYY